MHGLYCFEPFNYKKPFVSHAWAWWMGDFLESVTKCLMGPVGVRNKKHVSQTATIVIEQKTNSFNKSKMMVDKGPFKKCVALG